MSAPWETPTGPLDPGSRDPGYWPRFRGRIAALAEPELERRRRRSRETVAAVVSSWSRTIVPVAAAVAATAALLVLGDPAPRGTSLGGDEAGAVLDAAPNDDPFPALTGPDGQAVTVTMVDEPF